MTALPDVPTLDRLVSAVVKAADRRSWGDMVTILVTMETEGRRRRVPVIEPPRPTLVRLTAARAETSGS